MTFSSQEFLNRLLCILAGTIIKMGSVHQLVNNRTYGKNNIPGTLKKHTFQFQGKDVRVFVLEKDGKQKIYFAGDDIAKCLNMSPSAVLAQCPNATNLEAVVEKM